MPQTSYPRYNIEALAGLVKDLRLSDTISKTLQEITQFGVAVGSVAAQPDQARPPISNTAVILDDGGTWTLVTADVELARWAGKNGFFTYLIAPSPAEALSGRILRLESLAKFKEYLAAQPISR